MEKKHNNSFDYVGAALSDSSILATEASKVAFDSLRVDAFSKEKYMGMERITTSDMYRPVKVILERKLKEGTITKTEYDTLRHLKPGFYDPETGAMGGTSNAELYSLQGSDGKVDLYKVERFIKAQQNKAFMDECINNTKSVTITSSIVGCIFSSAKNFYKYFKEEQDIGTTAKNIGKDTAKAAGHGLLSSTIANGIKYVAFKGDNFFLRENVNALVIANGTIDLGRAFYYFKKGEISYNDFLNNVVGSTALTMINLGVNFVLAGHPLIKLVSTIVLNQIGYKLFGKGKSGDSSEKLNHKTELEIMDEMINEIEKANKDLESYMSSNMEIMKSINNVFGSDISRELFDKSISKLCISLGLQEEYQTYIDFDDIIDSGEKINVSFTRRKKDE